MEAVYLTLLIVAILGIPCLSFMAALGVSREVDKDSSMDKNTKGGYVAATFFGLLIVLGVGANWFLGLIKPDSVRESERSASSIQRTKDRDYEIRKGNEAIKAGNNDSAADWYRRASENSK